jgi:hypothetical protein
MVDLGFYNFIKNEIAKGKSKEDIMAELEKGGLMTPELFEQAWKDVQHDKTPQVNPEPYSAELYGPIRRADGTLKKSSNLGFLLFILVIVLIIAGFIFTMPFWPPQLTALYVSYMAKVLQLIHR